MSDPTTTKGGILAELRRRKVFRAAAVYAGVGFLLVQVANNFFPALHLPDWTMTLVAALVVLGFPVALVLAWALELTPDGIRRTTAVDAAPSPASAASRTARRTAAAGGALAMAMAAAAFLLLRGEGGAPAAADREPERSIAVLPFANLSADEENEYLSDGITEDIRGRLSRMGELRVISRTSAMTYKGTARPAREIGRELGVAHLLEGTVQRSRDRLRIGVQLVDALADSTIWSDSFDRDVTDVFAIQSEIAGRVAEALRVHLTAGERALLGRAHTTNIAAYELYLKADELLRRWVTGPAERRTNTLDAVALLRQSVELDPEYALPYALLAWGYEVHPDLPLRERRDSSRTFAGRVMDMAPDLPDGYAEMGWYYLSVGEPERAGAHFRMALERDANHEFALSGMAQYEYSSDRLGDALRYARRVIDVAPTDGDAHYTFARLYATLGDFDAAEEWSRRVWFEMVDDPAQGYCDAADLALHRGDFPGARRNMDVLRELDDIGEFALGCAAYMELALGDVEAARRYVERGARAPWTDAEGRPRFLLAALALHDGDTDLAESLLREEEERLLENWEVCGGRCDNYNLARVHALRGDADEAIAYVQRAVDTGWMRSYPSAPDPFMAAIEEDPRYQAILIALRSRLDRERERLARAGD